MDINLSVLAGLVLLGLFFIYLGYLHRVSPRDKKAVIKDDHNFSSRRISVFESFSSLFTVVGAGEYAFAIFLILVYGYFGSSFILGLATALFLISLFIRRVWIAKNSLDENTPSLDGYKSLTTPDYIYYKFGRVASIVASIITIFAFSGLLMMQFSIGGLILSELTHIPFTISVLFMATVVVTYTLIGGFGAVFFTDVWQKIFMWIGLISLIIFVYFFSAEAGVIAQRLGESVTNIFAPLSTSSLLTDPNVIILFVITIAAAFGGPDLWQRANFAKSASEAKKGLRLAAIAMIILSVILFLLAIHVSHMQSLHGFSSDVGLESYISIVANGLIPEYIILLFSLGMLSAFVSTADTSVMLILSAFANEYYRKQEKSVSVSRIFKILVILLVCAGAAWLAIGAPSIVDAFLGVLSILGVLGIPVFLSLFGFGNKYTFTMSCALGVVWIVYAAYFLPAQYVDGYYQLIPFAPAALNLLARKKKEQ